MLNRSGANSQDLRFHTPLHFVSHFFFNWEKEKRDLFLALIPKGVHVGIFFRVDDSAGHGEGEMHCCPLTARERQFGMQLGMRQLSA